MPINEYSGELLAESPIAVAEVLMNRVLAALEACPTSEPINESYVVIGELAFDNCCGVLAALPMRVFRTSVFPQQSVDVTNCDSTLLAVEVAVILLRCGVGLDAVGNVPSVEDMTAAFTAASNDAAVVYNELSGALPKGWERANLEQSYSTDGECVAVDTRLTIGLPQSEWCACPEVV
jgi:hypothetical protein